MQYQAGPSSPDTLIHIIPFFVKACWTLEVISAEPVTLSSATFFHIGVEFVLKLLSLCGIVSFIFARKSFFVSSFSTQEMHCVVVLSHDLK